MVPALLVVGGLVALYALTSKAPSPGSRDRDVFETGLASWYGPGFAGKPTANGETFDPSALTAAHKTLPFGTRVEVRRTDTGRTVQVRINDRGPFKVGRVIDLSSAAADILDMKDAGVVQVELFLVDTPARS